jgi:uncharacterized membrane protein
MRTRVRIARPGVHPVLIVLPLGLFGLAVAFDVIGALSALPVWGVIAMGDLGAGVGTGLGTATAGALAYRVLPPGSRARRVGMWHAIASSIALALFAESFALRLSSEAHVPGRAAQGLALLGLGCALGGGLLGAEIRHVARGLTR